MGVYKFSAIVVRKMLVGLGDHVVSFRRLVLRKHQEDVSRAGEKSGLLSSFGTL